MAAQHNTTLEQTTNPWQVAPRPSRTDQAEGGDTRRQARAPRGGWP